MAHHADLLMPTNVKRRQSIWLFVLTFVLGIGLFGWVAKSSQGFDDEMTNIALIENLGTLQAASVMQTQDVHPPGGYLLNGLLFDALHDWSNVRLVSALIYVLALCYLLAYVHRTSGLRAALVGLLLAGLAPAPLIWCTSLRWYAYFTPLLMWVLVPPRNQKGIWFHIKPALSWLLMAHISYAALVLLPAIWFWYYLQSASSVWQYIKRSMWPWLLAGLLFLPQLLIFLSVHSKGASSQTGGLVKSLMGVYISMASNQGLFPISVAGIASALGWAGFYVLLGRTALRKQAPASGLLSLALGTASFIVSGLASKFRNLVALQPWLVIASGQAERVISSAPKLAMCCFGLILVGNATGIYNVAMHEDTNKNSWNLPVDEFVQTIETMSTPCKVAPVVYGFDPVLSHALHERHPDWQVVNILDQLSTRALPNQADCLFTVYTFRGSLSPVLVETFQQAEQAWGGQLVKSVRLGLDRHAALKQKLDPDFPEHPIELHLLRGGGSLTALNRWARPTNKVNGLE
jgi:hypothetical protein